MLSVQIFKSALNELGKKTELTQPESSYEEISLPGAILPCACLIIMLIVLIICVNCASQPVKPETDSSPPFQEPQVKSNIILCDSEMVKFEYLMIIRIGSSTEIFSKNSWVDIAIIGKEGSVLGKTTRYKCELFPETRGINELHLTIGYIASLPPIKGLLVSHNLDSDSQLLLYDYTLIDTLQNTVIEERLFMKKITKKAKLFKGRPAPSTNDWAQQLKEKAQENEWTWVEKSLILSLITLSIACLVIVFEQTSAYFSFSDEDGSLYRSFFDILYVSVIGFCLLVLVLSAYKYCLRQKVTKSAFFDCCSFAFLSFYMVISFVLAGILLSFGTIISFPKSLFWLGSTYNICVVVFGFWCLYISFCEFCVQDNLKKSMYFGEDDTESFLAQFEPDTHDRHADRNVRTEKTTYLDGKTAMTNCEKQTVATNVSFGPKLINIKPKKAGLSQKMANSIAKCKEILVQKTILDNSNCVSKRIDKKISTSLSKDNNGNVTTANSKGKVKVNKT